MAYLSKQGSPWTTPILVALAGLALTFACIIGFRHVFRSNIRNVERRVRIWLDLAAAATKSIKGPEFIFSYQVTLNGKLFLVTQHKSQPEYIAVYSELNFTDEDNRRFATLPNGIVETIRALFLYLAFLGVGHSGVAAPLAKITLTKALLITPDFNAEKFMGSLFEVERALNVVIAICMWPQQIVKQQPA